MTREGGAISFAIRLLLGGAVISGGLLYAAQALQTSTPASRETVAEKIGPSLSSRQAQPVRPPVAPVEPTVSAPAPSVAPALQPAPQSRVSSTFATDPGPAPAMPPAVQSQNPPLGDAFGVLADEAGPDAAASEAKTATRNAAATGKGPRGAQGCTQYKSYNPQTQTYRTFDGKIKDCKP